MPPFIRERLYRDPVHDQIVFDRNSPEDRALLALIDTPEFQRLRRVRQLGMACVAYQGAEHSRFAHSVGVMWVATRILDRFQRAGDIDQVHVFPTRCAALLHDVGHGPFSHVLEGLFEKDHEEWTREIVCSSDCEINHVLCGHDLAMPSAVMSVLRREIDPPFFADIIAGQLDADRFDYLIRDSLMTGVKHGVFDLERMIYTLRLDRRGKRLVISDKDVLPVEKYLQSRYHMFKQVYQHKTVKAAEAMLTALLRRAMDLAGGGAADGGANGAADVASPADSAFGRFLKRRGKVSLGDYLALDDATFQHHWTLWRTHPDRTLSDLSARLLKRELFKSIEIDPSRPDFEARLEAARALLARHGFDPEYYLLRLESRDIPYRPFETGKVLSHQPILVESLNEAPASREPPAPRDLREVSHIADALAREQYARTRLAFPERKGAADLRAEMIGIFSEV